VQAFLYPEMLTCAKECGQIKQMAVGGGLIWALAIKTVSEGPPSEAENKKKTV